MANLCKTCGNALPCGTVPISQSPGSAFAFGGGAGGGGGGFDPETAKLLRTVLAREVPNASRNRNIAIASSGSIYVGTLPEIEKFKGLVLTFLPNTTGAYYLFRTFEPQPDATDQGAAWHTNHEKGAPVLTTGIGEPYYIHPDERGGIVVASAIDLSTNGVEVNVSDPRP